MNKSYLPREDWKRKMTNRGCRGRLVKKVVDRFCGVCGESDGSKVYKSCPDELTPSRYGGDAVRPPNFARIGSLQISPCTFASSLSRMIAKVSSLVYQVPPGSNVLLLSQNE